LHFCRGTRAKAGRVPLFCTRKGVKVKCQLCDKSAKGLTVLRIYTSEGIRVCEECYQAVENHRRQPYSKVMERLAMAEAGYRANRKRARLAKSAKEMTP
jgi:ribosome-binding protein aMBF1 (putative translation factor)